MLNFAHVYHWGTDETTGGRSTAAGPNSDLDRSFRSRHGRVEKAFTGGTMIERVCWTTLSVVAALVLLSVGAHGQTLQPSAVPGQCNVSPHAPLAELEQLKERLEQDVARKTAAAARHANEQENDVRKIQEQLLDVMFQIDCVRNAPPAARGIEPRSRSIAAPAPSAAAIEVTTYFATNRKRTDSPEPVKFYGSDFQPDYEYGRALVTIPRTHVPGNLEMPSLWKMELDSDANKHFVLKAVIHLTPKSARSDRGLEFKVSTAICPWLRHDFCRCGIADSSIGARSGVPGIGVFLQLAVRRQRITILAGRGGFPTL
jgi:hypothetical protein